MRSQVLRTTRKLAQQTRSFASEPAVTPPTAAPAPKKKGSSFGQRLSSFVVGFAVASGIGMYQLTQDVQDSTKDIQATMNGLKNEMVAQNDALSKRIEQLENGKK